MGKINVSKVNEALEELVVATANEYGGFEGFEDDDNYNMMLARNKIMAWHEAELAPTPTKETL